MRERLKGLGYSFYSKSDSEVLLYAYEQWGVECLQYLQGMFAFGIWDRRNDSFFVARDRLGIKPLYVHVEQGQFAFASEIKALVALRCLMFA